MCALFVIAYCIDNYRQLPPLNFISFHFWLNFLLSPRSVCHRIPGSPVLPSQAICPLWWSRVAVLTYLFLFPFPFLSDKLANIFIIFSLALSFVPYFLFLPYRAKERQRSIHGKFELSCPWLYFSHPAYPSNKLLFILRIVLLFTLTTPLAYK